ncbi:MAG: hypothetical protein KF721_07135 [Ignavibacteriaceae bacterium]|nr:hypothetical protein [Ignavibacteriaceae bacterium]
MRLSFSIESYPLKAKIFILLFGIIFSKNLYPQAYSKIIFNNENGLSSNLVKAIVHDSIGFTYIATDGGLVKFDGKSFKNIQNELPSLYIKDVHCTKKGEILVLTDFGLVKIEEINGIQKYINLVSASAEDSDSTLNYPKMIFEDSKGGIWISDLTGILHYSQGKSKKYLFDLEYLADSYFRSFQVIEIEKKIYAISMNGYFFEFNRTKERFSLLNFNINSPSMSIDAVLKTKENTLLLGTSKGIYQTTSFSNSNGIRFELISEIKSISTLCYDADDNLFVGSWHSGLYLKKKNSNSFSEYDLPISKSVKEIFRDINSNLWIGTDGGILLLKRTKFQKVDLPITAGYTSSTNISSLVFAKNKRIYFTDGQSIFFVNSADKLINTKLFYQSETNNIYTITSDSTGVWISFRGGRLEYRSHNSAQLIHSTTILQDRFNVLFVDKAENLWGYLGRSKRIMKFDRNFKTENIEIEENQLTTISVFHQEESGKILIGGNGRKAFLFEYSPEQKKFLNISSTFKGNINSNLYVMDIYNGSPKLFATSIGLFTEEGSEIEHDIYNENFKLTLTKSVLRSKYSTIWVGSENGVYALLKNDFIHFDKSDGLPNSSIIARGLVLDDFSRLWVGTAGGLAYASENEIGNNRTSTPIIIGYSKEIKSNLISGDDFQSIKAGSTIDFTFISIAYPADNIAYQYRVMGPGFDTTWSEPTKTNTLSLRNLSAGNYELHVTARDMGAGRSSTSRFNFKVEYNWYASPLMLLLYFLLLLVFVFLITMKINEYKINSLKRREKELSELVSKRTDALNNSLQKTENLLIESERAKDELAKANEFKIKLLNLAAHDLKNPLHAIIGFSSVMEEESEDTEVKRMAGFILQSSQAMVKQIEEILQNAAARAKEIQISKSEINLNKLLTTVVDKFSAQVEMKKQNIQILPTDDFVAMVDPEWLSHAIENIVSNAVKYTPFEKNIYIELTKGKEDFTLLVEDEGIGIDEKEIHLLFKEFQKLSGKPTGGESSTGLGLSIVKYIVELHGGIVWAESKLDVGTKFFIKIPLK